MAKAIQYKYEPVPPPTDTAQDDLNKLTETLHEKGVFRILNNVVAQSNGVLEVALGQLDSKGGRNAIDNTMVLIKALTEADPDGAQAFLDGTKKGLERAQDSLKDDPPGTLALLGKLHNPEVRRGLYAVLSLLEGLGSHLHEEAEKKG